MNNKIYVDATFKSIKKFSEELCGDTVEIVKNSDCFIIVLSDGLGSGVKANILSTLTSKIISTMMREGADIEDTVETVVHTLPVCSLRKVAYSTFSILQIKYSGEVYLVEFDSPSCIFIRDGKIMNITYIERQIAGKLIKEARFNVNSFDIITLISDGVVYAGVGLLLNFGWNWNNIAEFVSKKADKILSSARMTNLLIETCKQLYMNKPGDDSTVATVRIIPQMIVNLFSGPPENPKNDDKIINDFINSKGIKIICGGTSANIASRILKEPITVNMDCSNAEVPPIGYIKGIDLVTEGVLTLKKTVDIIENYIDNPVESDNIASIDAYNGAAKIAKILMEQCTHLNLFVGRKINPAHQNPKLAFALSIKFHILTDLYSIMTKVGKVVTIKYY